MMAHPRLTEVLVEVTESLVSDLDLVAFFHDLAGHAATVSGADAVGIVLADHHGVLRFMTASNQPGAAMELFQLQAEEGPCLDCYRQGEPVVNTDLAHAGERWPSFAPRAADAGFRAVHALPLRARHHAIGALNLFTRDEDHLDQEALRGVQALADLATVAVAQQQWLTRSEDLLASVQVALNEQIVVEQAKGALAQRRGIDVDAAYDVLRTRASSTGSQVVDVARQVLDDRTDTTG